MNQSRPRRRFLRLILIIPVALVAAVALWGLLDSYSGASARTTWNRTWRAEDGHTLGGYLITPSEAIAYGVRQATGTTADALPSADGRRPAVLLIHELFGLNTEIAAMADQLARDGYIVLAPDAFRGRLAVTAPGALMQMVTVSDRRIAADLGRALAELRSHPDVDPQRIAVVGFCFGGTQTMRFANTVPGFAAAAIFYGGSPITEADDIGLLGRDAPLLGIYGANDPTIPVADVEAFRELVDVGEVPVDITIVEGEGHAFVNPRTIRERGAAADAWDRLRAFLREHV